jgi:hypothetical protein
LRNVTVHPPSPHPHAILRVLALATSCAALAGCAAVAVMVVTQAAITAGAELAVSAGVATAFAVPAALESKRCEGNRGGDATVAAAESAPDALDLSTGSWPVRWRQAWIGAGGAESLPDRAAEEGAIAFAESSIVFVAVAQSSGFDLPYGRVIKVETPNSPVSSMVITSCGGRVDHFTFWRKPENTIDAKATLDAAAVLKTRLQSVP